jgi:hypothetical protein
VALVGTQRTITTAADFFETQHEGMGVQVTIGMVESYASIVRVVSPTVAILGGNPLMATGAALVDIYEPKRDPLVVDGAPLAGRRVYQVELASGLPASLADQTRLDLRRAPLSVGAFPLASTVVRIATEMTVLPGDRLYFSSSSFRHVELVTDTGLTHHTTGFKVYDVLLGSGSPSALVDNQPLYSVSNDPCFPNGDPVTPLKLISMAPSAYLVP